MNPAEQRDALVALCEREAEYHTLTLQTLAAEKFAHVAKTLRAMDLAAIPIVPDGWALVPVYPTIEMQNACWRVIEGTYTHELPEAGDVIWRVMLAAAPTPGGEKA